MIIATTVPNNYFAPWDFVKSMLQLPAKYSYYATQGVSVPDNRNRIVEYVKSTDQDFLLVDSDMKFTSEDVAKIEEHLNNGLDVISGVCVLGRPPYESSVFKRIKGDYELTDVPKELSKVDAVGTAFVGISNKILHKLQKDPFLMLWEGDIQHGNDISFCHSVNEVGEIWLDPTISVGHIRVDYHYYEQRTD